eukprot:MONOS_5637.1-p1 / transcript=MONOS_5637.1 / gene=MONOS_5637 / organism=Monocercomonoides_exilis_PA203 / gene_product=unspecified product / transcript_product=unspecified product / location=Mono_scaffold00166:67915-69420(-) / protein_length=474 / sequence_SO=supercontig / SO=protein_coding / is_pseudo=false
MFLEPRSKWWEDEEVIVTSKMKRKHKDAFEENETEINDKYCQQHFTRSQEETKMLCNEKEEQRYVSVGNKRIKYNDSPDVAIGSANDFTEENMSLLSPFLYSFDDMKKILGAKDPAKVKNNDLKFLSSKSELPFSSASSSSDAPSAMLISASPLTSTSAIARQSLCSMSELDVTSHESKETERGDEKKQESTDTPRKEQTLPSSPVLRDLVASNNRKRDQINVLLSKWNEQCEASLGEKWQEQLHKMEEDKQMKALSSANSTLNEETATVESLVPFWRDPYRSNAMFDLAFYYFSTIQTFFPKFNENLKEIHSMLTAKTSSPMPNALTSLYATQATFHSPTQPILHQTNKEDPSDCSAMLAQPESSFADASSPHQLSIVPYLPLIIAQNEKAYENHVAQQRQLENETEKEVAVFKQKEQEEAEGSEAKSIEKSEMTDESHGGMEAKLLPKISSPYYHFNYLRYTIANIKKKKG